MKAVFSLLFAILIFVCEASDVPSCPSGWSLTDDKRCIKVFDWPAQYEQARSWCRSFGTLETRVSDLVSIRSFNDNAKLSGLLQGKSAWIGLKSKNGGNPTVWSDETPVSYNNYERSLGANQCAVINAAGKWTPVSCTSKANFACELVIGFKKDCSGYASEKPGVKTIQISEEIIVRTYCDRELTVIQSRGEGNYVNFDQSVEGYFETLGEPGKNTNFWLGLQKMYLLLQKPNEYNLAIQICCGTKPGLVTTVKNVTLGDKSTTYVLNGHAVTDVGLNFLNVRTDLGSPFSTYHTYAHGADFCDVLNNRIVKAGTGGFWFGSCGNNLNGYYYRYNSSYYSNVEKCILDKDRMSIHGTGIEIRTYESAFDPDYLFDGISWTRARMVIYPMTSNPDLNANAVEYCADFK